MTEISLEGQVFIDLKIDDQDIPSGLPNFLQELAIIENVAGVPVMTMTINDSQGFISENIPLTDGNKFSIVIARTLSDLKERASLDFRLFNWNAVQFQQGFTYKVNAIFDNNKFVTEVISKAYLGSTDYVLSEVAKSCDLTYESTATCADTQQWLNFSDTLSTFVRKVVQHSFLQGGCMASAISADGTLIYKDLLGSINGEPDQTFDSAIPDEKKDILLLQEFSPSSSAGFMNAWLNYGYISVEDFLTGKSAVYDSVTLTTTSGGSAAINSDVSSEVGSVRKDYIVQDCGNTHERYWKAFHNNIRILSLFSQKMIFIVDQVTELDLLDVVYLNIRGAADNKPTTFSGKYIIGAKKTMVKGTKYAEIFEVYRNTLPKKGTAKLASGAAALNSQTITSKVNTPEKKARVVKVSTGPVSS
jgi:hypothetical protein